MSLVHENKLYGEVQFKYIDEKRKNNTMIMRSRRVQDLRSGSKGLDQLLTKFEGEHDIASIMYIEQWKRGLAPQHI